MKIVAKIPDISNLDKDTRKFHENLLKFWNWCGAKAGKSCSYRKKIYDEKFKNAYLGETIGFDAEENEPSEVCSLG